MSSRPILASATIVTAALVIACASAGSNATSSKGDCSLRPQDSTFAAHAPLYRACAVERKASKIATRIVPEFRPTNQGNGCYVAEVEFVVTPLGVPDAATARVLRTNTKEYADAVLAILPQLRYEPAQRGGVPVAQIVVETSEMITKTVTVPVGQRPNPGRRGPGC